MFLVNWPLPVSIFIMYVVCMCVACLLLEPVVSSVAITVTKLCLVLRLSLARSLSLSRSLLDFRPLSLPLSLSPLILSLSPFFSLFVSLSLSLTFSLFLSFSLSLPSSLSPSFSFDIMILKSAAKEETRSRATRAHMCTLARAAGAVARDLLFVSCIPY